MRGRSILVWFLAALLLIATGAAPASASCCHPVSCPSTILSHHASLASPMQVHHCAMCQAHRRSLHADMQYAMALQPAANHCSGQCASHPSAKLRAFLCLGTSPAALQQKADHSSAYGEADGVAPRAGATSHALHSPALASCTTPPSRILRI